MRVAAIVPVASIEGAKTRLGESLDAEERHDLVERLLARTVGAVLAAQRVDDVVVVSPDRDVLALAAQAGARTLRQRTTGLNPGITEATTDAVAGGAEAIVVIPIDLPFVTAHDVDLVLAALDDGPRMVVLTPDRHGTGTNALVLRPPGVIDVAFGSDSRAAHRAAAIRADATYREITGPLTVDLDTPADLVYLESLDAERRHAG